MPKVYLSPSTQHYNLYYSDDPQINENNSEEYYMNLVADAIEPYLLTNKIQYKRNKPDMKVSEIVKDSNNFNADLHVAIHSNASPPNFAGILQGPDIYHYRGSKNGIRAGEILNDEMKEIYPNPDLVTILPNSTLEELTGTKAPAVYVEVAYHDNPSDAAWIKSNIKQIGRAIATGISEYFDLDFIEPAKFTIGKVNINEGNLNIRSAPNTNSSVIGKLKKGDPVIILREPPGWYLVAANGVSGYVDKRYIEIL